MSLNRYDVHIYPINRVKVSGVQAETPEAAVKVALDQVDLYEVNAGEFSDGIDSFLVDCLDESGQRIAEIDMDSNGERMPKPDVILERALKMMSTMAPVDWEKYVDGLKDVERRELSEKLAGLMQWTARAFGYVDDRHGDGCGDQGHAAAVARSNKMAAGVRKAIGYSQPKHDIKF